MGSPFPCGAIRFRHGLCYTVRDMELRHLRYFIGAAEDLSFTKTAKRLRLTQPSLSRQIRQLEQDAGVRFFTRHSDGVRLTDAGRIFLPEARSIMEQAERALQLARQAKAGEIGQVRLAIAGGVGSRISEAIKQYQEHSPRVEIECRNINSGFQSEALRLHQVDVGFLRPHIDQLHLESVFLFDEPLLALLPRRNPLAGVKKVGLKALAELPLLLAERQVCTSMYDTILRTYQKAGVRPKIISTTNTPFDEAGAILITSGKGLFISVGPHPFHPAFSDQITAVALDDPAAKLRLHMAWRRGGGSRAVLEFVRIAKAYFQSTRSKNGARTARGTRTG